MNKHTKRINPKKALNLFFLLVLKKIETKLFLDCCSLSIIYIMSPAACHASRRRHHTFFRAKARSKSRNGLQALRGSHFARYQKGGAEFYRCEISSRILKARPERPGADPNGKPAITIHGGISSGRTVPHVIAGILITSYPLLSLNHSARVISPRRHDGARLACRPRCRTRSLALDHTHCLQAGLSTQTCTRLSRACCGLL